MKYLVIAALFALLLLLLYSKLYPYINAVKKILGAAKTMANATTDSGGAFAGPATKVDRKLVRCVACGTWIPADRAVGARAGGPVYCSRECIENPAAADERKAAS